MALPLNFDPKAAAFKLALQYLYSAKVAAKGGMTAHNFQGRAI